MLTKKMNIGHVIGRVAAHGTGNEQQRREQALEAIKGAVKTLRILGLPFDSPLVYDCAIGVDVVAELAAEGGAA